MENFIFINKDIFKQLADDELLIYCYGVFEAKANMYHKFSISILNHDLKLNSNKLQARIKNALDGLIVKGLIENPAKDVYIICKPEKPKTEQGQYYFVLYDIEFEALKSNSKLLRYFCFILSCLNNKTHQWQLSNSFIQKGSGISKATIISYNKTLTELKLIEVITTKKDNNTNNINVIRRINNNLNNNKAKVIEMNNLTTAKEIEVKAETVREVNADFGVDNLKSRLSDIIGVDEKDIILYPSQLKKISEAGQDKFLSAIKSCLKKYDSLLNNQKQSLKDRVNIFISCVIRDDLEREVTEIKRREQQIKQVMNKKPDQSEIDYLNHDTPITVKAEVRTDLSWILNKFED
jgi:hypothetical protein